MTVDFQLGKLEIPHDQLKWSWFSGQVCGFAKVYQIYVHAAFRVSVWLKYAVSGVRLSRAVWGRSEL